MDTLSFSIFPNDNFLDLRLYQYGWEQCEPLHSYGPSVRNHYLFHYILSGQGSLDSPGEDNTPRRYELTAGQGFLISPGQVTTYSAAKQNPWKYVWLEFDGLKAAEFLSSAGLDPSQPIYRPRDTVLGELMGGEMLYIRRPPPCTSSATCASSWTPWSAPPPPSPCGRARSSGIFTFRRPSPLWSTTTTAVSAWRRSPTSAG